MALFRLLQNSWRPHLSTVQSLKPVFAKWDDVAVKVAGIVYLQQRYRKRPFARARMVAKAKANKRKKEARLAQMSASA